MADGLPARALSGLYRMGEHRLAIADARDPATWLNLMAGEGGGVECADVVWTDPPYGIQKYSGAGARSHTRREGGIKKVHNDELCGADLTGLWVDALAHVPVRTGTTLYFFGNWRRQREFWEMVDLLGEKAAWHGLEVRGECIWNKNQMGLCHQDHPRYRMKHETCWWLSVGGYEWHAGFDQSTVWDIPRWRGPRPGNHPTPKTLETCAKPLRNSAKPGYTVVDPFAGSGHALLTACLDLGLKARMVERDASYGQSILDLYHQLTGESAELIATW